MVASIVSKFIATLFMNAQFKSDGRQRWAAADAAMWRRRLVAVAIAPIVPCVAA